MKIFGVAIKQENKIKEQGVYLERCNKLKSLGDEDEWNNCIFFNGTIKSSLKLALVHNNMYDKV